MKTIFVVALLAISIFSLACNKANQENSNLTANSNSPQTNAKASANIAQANGSAPVDSEQVKQDLVAVYAEFLKAMREGDKTEMDRLLADDFSARLEAKLFDKADWIQGSPGNPEIKTQEITGPELISYDGNTAVLHLTVRNSWNDNNPPSIYMRSASFVKRGGKWQIKNVINGI